MVMRGSTMMFVIRDPYATLLALFTHCLEGRRLARPVASMNQSRLRVFLDQILHRRERQKQVHMHDCPQSKDNFWKII